MKKNQGFMRIVIVIIIVTLIFLLVGLLYRDTTQKKPDEFGRVIDSSVREINTGATDVETIERNPDRTVARDVERADSNLLPTERVSIGSSSFVYPPILFSEKEDENTVRIYHTSFIKEEIRDACLEKEDDIVKVLLTDFDMSLTHYATSAIAVFNGLHDEEERTIEDLVQLPLHGTYRTYEYSDEVTGGGCQKAVYIVEKSSDQAILIYRIKPSYSAVATTTTDIDNEINKELEESLFKTIIGGIL